MWTLFHLQFLKKSRRWVPANINLVFLLLVCSSTNKGKTGKPYASVAHGLHTSHLLLYLTEIWFVHTVHTASAGSFSVLISQSNAVGSRRNEPVWRSQHILDAMFFTCGPKLLSLVPSLPRLLFSVTPIFTSHASCLCLHECNFFESQNKLH